MSIDRRPIGAALLLAGLLTGASAQPPPAEPPVEPAPAPAPAPPPAPSGGGRPSVDVSADSAVDFPGDI